MEGGPDASIKANCSSADSSGTETTFNYAENNYVTVLWHPLLKQFISKEVLLLLCCLVEATHPAAN